MNGDGYSGIHEVTVSSINKCVPNVNRLDLYHNVVLAGGTTKITHFQDRFKKEVKELAG